MGVGINEASKLVGTAITASVAGRMIGNEKEQALQGGVQAATTLADVGEGIKADLEEKNELVDTIKRQGKDAETLQSMLKPGMSKEDIQAWNELNQELNVDMEKADVAFKVLQGKIIAKTALMQRAKRQLDRSNLWGGNK